MAFLQRFLSKLTDTITTTPDGVTSQPVTGSVTANAGTNLNTSALAVESGGNLATIAGKDFATQTTLALIKAKTDNLDTALSGIKTGTDKIVTAAALDATVTTTNTEIGGLTETAPASDTASSGLNGRLQRIAQNITTLIATVLQVQGGIAAGATDSGNPVKTGGIYSPTLPTLTNGQRGNNQIGTRGSLNVSLFQADSATSLTSFVNDNADGLTPASGGLLRASAANRVFNGATWDRMPGDTNATKVEERFSYSHISTSTTTTVKSGAGYLKSVTVNSKGTIASTITIYDNTAGSGTVIGIIDSLNLGGTFTFNVNIATGITIVTTGTVAPDVTVSYR